MAVRAAAYSAAPKHMRYRMEYRNHKAPCWGPRNVAPLAQKQRR